MVRYCCVKNCWNRKKTGQRDPGISFYGFPASRKIQGRQVSEITRMRRMAWVAAIRRPDITFDKMPKAASVCSLHFHKGKPALEMSVSDPDWAPSLNLGDTVMTSAPPNLHLLLQQRVHLLQTIPQVKEEEIQTVIVGAGAEYMEENKPVVQCQSCVQKYVEIKKLEGELQVLKSYQMNECYFCLFRRNDINCLLEENRVLKSKLEKFKMESFLSGDDKVKYHTGLPNLDTFEALLNAVAPCLPQNVKFLSPYQMFLLTFMRLRLNLPLKYLIYLFQTNRRTAVLAFTDTISTLNAQFSHVVQCLCREAIKLDLHGFFESPDDRMAVMVDIFDISTLRGSTVKYLISASPQGNITFISKAFEGNISDEEIIEKSGILEPLLPGDLILANRFYELDVNPDGGRKSLKVLPKCTAVVMKIFYARVPVKRAVSNIQKFTFLTRKVPPIMLRRSEGHEEMLLDKVVKVCCAITNMWPPKANEKNSTE